MRYFVLLLAIGCGVLAFGRPQSASAAQRFIDEVFPNVTVTSNIAYGEAIDEYGQPETLLLDVYQPAGDNVSNRPVVIFVHGGSFTGGSKTSPAAVDYARSMAKRGYVSASIDYRLREAGFPPEEQFQVVLDAKHDAQAAIRWFRANAATYEIDPNRISIAGYSAGAATVLFAGYFSEDVGDSGNPGLPSDVSAVIDISGSMGNLADDLMAPGEPPVLIVHGTNDQTVDYAEATEIVAAAEGDGIPYELHTLQGVGHSKFGDLTDEIAQWSGVFLYNQVVVPEGSVGGLTRLTGVGSNAGTRAVWWLGAAFAAGACAAAMLRRRLRRRRRRGAPLQ
jgi:acetyl esterase/lipase